MSSSTSSAGDAGGRKTPADPEKPHPSEFVEFATIAPIIARPSIAARTPTFQKPGEKFEALSPTTTSTSRVNITQSNDDLFHGMSAAVPGLRRLSVDARAGAEAEHKMTFLGGCRLYPKAIGWSLLLSCTIIMEGYDKTLINSFYAFPIFRRSYGTPIYPNAPVGSQDFQISPSWQSGLTNAAVCAEIVGLLFNGLFTDRFGYHRTMIGALIWLCLVVFLPFFAPNITTLLVGQIFCGLSWGIFQTLSTSYAAEVMPVTLRAYLLSNVNMCWLIGQVCGVGVIRGLVHNTSQWAYRIPFALQWAFALPLLVGVLFAPESPWWLVRHERPEEAKKALERLTQTDKEEFNADDTIALMRHTNELEKFLNNGGMSYLDCFKGTDRRRTEIACMVWITQAVCGSALTGYAAYFYEQAGFDTANSFDLAVGMYGLAIMGGILSWVWMRLFGRRTLYIWGLVGSFIILIVAGIVSTRPDSKGVSWTVGSLVILLTFVYDSTIGPVCYVLVAEIPSTRLRVKTVVLARVAYNIASVITNVITPRMLNPTAWNWRGKSCFLFAGSTLLILIWCYFRLPEPKGLTYMELDILFNKKAKTRKFREFQVNLASTGYFSLSRGMENSHERQGSVWRGGYT